MNYLKKHTVYRVITFIIVVTLLTPIFVKSSHVFSDHKHEVCIGENQSHFHEIDLDCEFFNFKINHNVFFEFSDYTIKSTVDSNAAVTAYYSYLKSHQRLTTQLRGPPLLM